MNAYVEQIVNELEGLMASITVTPQALREIITRLSKRLDIMRELQAEMETKLPQGIFFPQAPDITGAFRAFVELSNYLETEMEVLVPAQEFGESWKDKRRKKGIVDASNSRQAGAGSPEFSPKVPRLDRESPMEEGEGEKRKRRPKGGSTAGG